MKNDTTERDTVRLFPPPKADRFTPPGSAVDCERLLRAYHTAPESLPPGARRYLDRVVVS